MGNARAKGLSLVVSAITGQLPLTVTRLDRSSIPPQQAPVSTLGLTFNRPVLERFYRQGGAYPPVSTRFLLTDDGANFYRVVRFFYSGG
jgi:hypothetical protein